MPAPPRRLALLMCISLCLAGGAFGVEFASPSAYAVGSSPQSVVAGDFNGDGKQDLAVLNTAGLLVRGGQQLSSRLRQITAQLNLLNALLHQLLVGLE